MATDQDPLALVGSLVDRRYDVTKLITTGGQAYLYHAVDQHDAGEVALKVFRPAGTTAAEQQALRRQVFTEATLLGAHRHPNLVPFVGVGTLLHGGVELPFLATRWVNGLTLAEVLDARTRTEEGRSPHDTLTLLSGVLSALAHLHAHGVVHGDVKPSNIMVSRTADGRITTVLVDLGIARSTRVQGSRPMTLWMFSPDYAPPEAFNNLPLTPAADVYAMACVVTEVLTDKRVNDGDSPQACCGKVMTGMVPTPKDLGVDVGALEDVLQIAMSRDASARFVNAAALLRALETAVLGRARDGLSNTSTLSMSSRGANARARPDSPGIGTALALLFAAAVCGAVVSMVATPRRAPTVVPVDEAPVADRLRDARTAAHAAAQRITTAPVAVK